MANTDEGMIGLSTMSGPRLLGEDDPRWGDAIHVDCERQVRALVAEILNPDRYYPIICLTACIGEREPALDPACVRSIVGPAIPIYVLTRFLLSMKLARRLPRRVVVHSGAARVWWPEVSQQSQSSEHPQFFEPANRDTPADGYRRLAAEFYVPEHPDLTVEQRLVLAERGRTKEQQQRRTVERHLADLRGPTAERHPRRAPQAAPASRERPLRLVPPAEDGPALDPEQRLHILIAYEWVQAQSSPADRADHPLGRYILGRQFVQSVERKPAGVSTQRIARVCAMVACKRATQVGCEPHTLRRGPSPTAPPWRRTDGATAWRCALKAGRGGPRLHYWQLLDGTIEFASVVTHDDFSIPGG